MLSVCFRSIGLQTPITPSSDPIILKLVYDPIQHVLADRFFKKLGFSTPNYSVIAKESPLGQKAIAELKEKGVAFLENEIASPHYSDARKDILTQQKRALERDCSDKSNKDYVTIMETVKASSFRQLTVDDIETTLADKKIMTEMGQMIFFDMFIANTDRLNKISANIGNFLIKPLTARNNEKSIALIDHDYKINSFQKNSIIENLRELLHDDNAIEKIIDSFINITEFEINQNRSDDNQITIHCNRSEMADHMRNGIQAAKNEVLDKFFDDSLVDDLLELPEHFDKYTKPEPMVFIELLKTLKTL